jgi:hypothetical protein
MGTKIFCVNRPVKNFSVHMNYSTRKAAISFQNTARSILMLENRRGDGFIWKPEVHFTYKQGCNRTRVIQCCDPVFYWVLGCYASAPLMDTNVKHNIFKTSLLSHLWGGSIILFKSFMSCLSSYSTFQNANLSLGNNENGFMSWSISVS